jgi:hypothetical protein
MNSGHYDFKLNEIKLIKCITLQNIRMDGASGGHSKKGSPERELVTKSQTDPQL